MSFFNRTVKKNDADDDELLTVYRSSGDLAALGALYEKWVPMVYGVCLEYLRDEEKAKDAVMGIFEELVLKVKKHNIKEFRKWLYVVARNYCLMQMRPAKKMETVNLDDFMEFTPVLHPEESDREAALRSLERCVEKLPAPQRKSIGLFYLKQMCYREVADNTGFTLNEVKSYIQNGKRNLKICLENVSE